jgi:hypothetical protein
MEKVEIHMERSWRAESQCAVQGGWRPNKRHIQRFKCRTHRYWALYGRDMSTAALG